MRSDMAKVIVERPRRGGGIRYPRSHPDSHRLDIEDFRSRQGMRRPWLSSHAKGLNENLAPLERYLRTHVGRPWDDIYSEICEHMNRNSAVQLHIWQHLMQFVCRDVYVTLGLVKPSWWHGAGRFYVDPSTGILRENLFRWRYRRPEPKPDPNRVPASEDIEYRRIEGIWYELRLAPIPKFRIGYDFAIRKHLTEISDDLLHKFYDRQVYAARKRQLNKKEIRKLGLTTAGTKS